MGSSSPRCGPRVVCAPRVVVVPRDVARGRCRERLRAPRGSGDFGGPPRCPRGVVVRVSDRGSAPDVSRAIVGGAFSVFGVIDGMVTCVSTDDYARCVDHAIAAADAYFAAEDAAAAEAEALP